jgi:hypothetical protein
LTDESSTTRLLEKELDRQGGEISELKTEVKVLPSIRTEVEMLKETVKQNTQVMYILVGLIISSGAITALITKVL